MQLTSRQVWYALILVTLAASPVFLIALNIDSIGYILLGLCALLIRWLRNTEHRKELTLVIVCLLILNFVDINTSTLTRNFLTMWIPLLLISFGSIWRTRWWLQTPLQLRLFSHKPASWPTLLYPLLAFVLAGLLIPWYFSVNPEVPLHRTLSSTPTKDELQRLFWWSNFLGMRDEVFFINVVFSLLRRQVSFWKANIVQACFFTSFLYELAFTGIWPLVIFPFALLQWYIYEHRESVGYIIIIHLLIDSALYLSIVSAHAPGWYRWFPWM